MKWTSRTYGTSKAPGFESECKEYDVMKLPNGRWRLVSHKHVAPAGNPYWFKDFPTAKQAKEYAEVI